ncbi:MAG: glycosyltransferase family 2 protein [Bacteroidota bacterium]
MVPISAVIITFNEEKNIERCLNSLVGIADDIVVVDSFSKDRTKEICLEKGARFIEHAFEGHIEQKNWAITQAKYPHVLSLDADEELSEELKKSILEAKNNWLFDAYSMNRLTNYCGNWIKHCGWYPDTKLRLWDSRKGSWGGTNPHDKYIMNENCSEDHLKGDLFHYSFYTIDQHLQQINKFSDISSKALFNKGVKSSFLKSIYKPMAKFIRNYIIKMGFLDGYYGYVICRLSAYSTFLKYVKLKTYYK